MTDGTRMEQQVSRAAVAVSVGICVAVAILEGLLSGDVFEYIVA